MLWDESADTLEVSGTVVAAAGTALLPSITTTGDLNTGIFFPAADTIAFAEGGTEAMRIDSSGRVLIGTDSSIEVESYYRPKFQVAQAGSSDSAARGILINYGRNDTGGGAAVMYSRHSGTAVGSEGNVANNYVLGENKYTGWYSDNYYLAANIKVEVDGTPSSADMPGRIIFATTADGASSPTERMRIDSSGNVGIGTSSSTVWNGASGTKLLVGGASNTITSLQSSSTAINQGGIFEAYSTAVTSGSAALGSIAFLRENTSTAAARSYTSFFTNDGGTVGEQMRIDSSGRVLIGITTTRDDFYQNDVAPSLQVEGSNTSKASISATQNAAASADGPRIFLGRPSGTQASSRIVVRW
jgi:hypothetical protein